MDHPRNKFLFIVNPVSGFRRGQKNHLRAMIRSFFRGKETEIRVRKTRFAQHAALLGQKARDEAFDVVVAVGGDGTINQVSKQLIHTDLALGILPRGSGNGLARYLGIPMNPKKALGILIDGVTRRIDTASMGGHFFVNMAGIGFDAHIAGAFAESVQRGIGAYIRLTLSEFSRYQPKKYTIEVEGKTIEEEAFLISFANSNQYGSNAYISPQALIDDGLIDMVIMKPFPLSAAAGIAFNMLSSRIHLSPYVRIYRGREFTIRHEHPLTGHVDGEPVALPTSFSVKVNPGSLTVICPK